MMSITQEERRLARAAAARGARALIDTPHDVTEKRQAEEIQRDVADIRNRERPEGRYSINEAVALLLVETGELFRVGQATWNGELRAYAPGSRKPIDTKGNDPKKWTTYDTASEVYWNDLNDWLKENYPRVKYEFPNPDTAPFAVKQEEPIRIIFQRCEAILNWLIANNHDPKNLPTPLKKGLATVKASCREELCKNKKMFSSLGIFEKAWQQLRADKKIKGLK